MDEVREEIKELRDNLNKLGGSRIRTLEDNFIKLESDFSNFKATHDKQETKIELFMDKMYTKLDSLNRMYWIGMGVVGVLSFVGFDGIKAIFK